MSLHSAARLALLATLAVSVAACDGGGEEGLPATTYTLRIDGGDTRTFSGSAFFGEGGPDGQSLFGILLGAEGGAGASPYVSFVRLSAAPPAGTYALADVLGPPGAGLSSFVGVYLDPSQFDENAEDEGSFTGVYYIRSGTLTIDRIDPDDAVEGSFRATAQGVTLVGFDPDDPSSEISLEPTGDPILIEGEFNASFRADLFDDAFLPEDDAPAARLLRL